MKPVTVEQLAIDVNGTLAQGRGDVMINDLVSDSRLDCTGSLFVPFTGEKFDGHDFIEAAAKNGAAAMFYSRPGEVKVPANVAVIRVEDTLKAYQAAARANRWRCTAKVFGLTGSSGKTSSKTLLANVLSSRETVSTLKNENNEIGAPKTLLMADDKTEFVIVEMGMRGPGEIAELASVALPDFGIITNVGTAHIGRLGSEEAIASAKGELLAFVNPAGKVFLNADNKWTEPLRQLSVAEVITFGMEKGDVTPGDVKYTIEGVEYELQSPWGTLEVKTPMPGKAGVYNSLSAAAAGFAAGLPADEIARNLSLPVEEGGRLRRVETKNGQLVLDDSYNANPDSMQLALDLLSRVEWSGRRVAVLADMLELGEHSRREHFSIGVFVAASGVNSLITMGEEAKHIAEGASSRGMDSVHAFESFEEIENEKKNLFRSGDLVLVKGSRGMKTERIVNMIAEMS